MAGPDVSADMPFEAILEAAILEAPVLPIAGGTGEVMRSIIIERVPGLRADGRVDKGQSSTLLQPRQEMGGNNEA